MPGHFVYFCGWRTASRLTSEIEDTSPQVSLSVLAYWRPLSFDNSHRLRPDYVERRGWWESDRRLGMCVSNWALEDAIILNFSSHWSVWLPSWQYFCLSNAFKGLYFFQFWCNQWPHIYYWKEVSKIPRIVWRSFLALLLEYAACTRVCVVSPPNRPNSWPWQLFQQRQGCQTYSRGPRVP